MTKTKQKIITIMLAILMLFIPLALSACGEKDDNNKTINYPTTDKIQIVNYTANALNKLKTATSLTAVNKQRSISPSSESLTDEDAVSTQTLYYNNGIAYTISEGRVSPDSTADERDESWYFKDGNKTIVREKSSSSPNQVSEQDITANVGTTVSVLEVVFPQTIDSSSYLDYEIVNNMLKVTVKTKDVGQNSKEVTITTFTIYDGQVIAIETYMATSVLTGGSSGPNSNLVFGVDIYTMTITYDTNPTIPTVPEKTAN